MERRKFLQQSTLAGLSSLAFGSAVANTVAKEDEKPAAANTFNLNYAPHDGMFTNTVGKDFLDQIKYMHEQGFRAIEDNGMMGRDVALQEKIGNLLAKLNMTMGVFVIDAGDNWKTSLTTGKAEFLDRFLAECKKAVEVAKRVNAKWMTVVPGYFERRLPIGIQTGHVIDALRRGSEILEKHNLTMVLEPLSDNPDLFLRTSDQTFEICRAVNSPSCKILFDIYHMQRNEGHIIEHMNWAWEEIAYIQIGDNPGRKEPTTGEINYKNVFKHIYNKGFKGVCGMEHGISLPGKEGEARLVQAYREVDNFLSK
ncbi:hydroxypyruvate isomerase [Chitinophaga skermanii]|uniref:Hydroxypyruvate isomerase n=1 Tax=Chitinophaga skermanii TaxID=331697 RepID=A0A327Q2M6_9BACT|nr:TIM barrel protein [Chitinophaga skermanii]RAI98715.1 hydroxypyruvate isomerase [Chitinophaga skermanii]